MKKFNRNNRFDEALINAAKDGNLQGVKDALDNGANIEAENFAGYRALTMSASWGARDCLEFLISKGAEVNHETQPGSTPLKLAVSMQHVECAKLLIDAGADVEFIESAKIDEYSVYLDFISEQGKSKKSKYEDQRRRLHDKHKNFRRYLKKGG